MEENNCKYVCSRGILKSCDIHSLLPISDIKKMINYDFFNLTNGSTIYISTSCVKFFINNLLKSFKYKFILVSGDSDCTNPSDIFSSNEELKEFIDSEKIIHWFSQNCILPEHPKITQIPIGLDYHTMVKNNTSWGESISSKEQENILENIRTNSKPFYERIIKAYSNFHFFMDTKFGYDRKDAVKFIPENLIYYEPNKITRIETWKNQSEYAFVVSPHGNGLDCHRTWEALCLGCIPIVKTSPLDKLYEELPVLILKDWSELTQELLENTINEFKNRKFNYEKLTLKYWMDKINSYKNPFKLDNKIMKEKTVVIAGCCINVEKYIKRNLFVMDEIGKQFKDYKIVIFENDSKDNTRKILTKNKKENYHFIFEDNINIENRTERIAYCRNKLLRYIKQTYLEYDYLLMLDLDDVLASGQLIYSISSCFLYKAEQWDAMFANCSDKYYDIFALRKKNYLMTCCWNDTNMMKLNGVEHNVAYKTCIDKYIINYPVDKKLMSVISAFGGAGLYKIKSIGDAEYNGVEPKHITKQICEHVPFNTALIEKGCKLYINPKMLIR
jgi:hypothetical protein